MTTLTRAIALAWLRVRIAWLAWEIDSAEAYLRACQRDGIVDGVSIRAWRSQCSAQAARLLAMRADALNLVRSMRGAR